MKAKAAVAVPSLIARVADKEESVRSAAIYALADIGAKLDEVVPVISRALDDEAWVVRNAAVDGLERLAPSSKDATAELNKALGAGCSPDR